MSEHAGRGVLSFFDVFRREAETISARREAVAEGRLSLARGATPAVPREPIASRPVRIGPRRVRTADGTVDLQDERGRPVPSGAPRHYIFR